MYLSPFLSQTLEHKIVQSMRKSLSCIFFYFCTILSESPSSCFRLPRPSAPSTSWNCPLQISQKFLLPFSCVKIPHPYLLPDLGKKLNFSYSLEKSQIFLISERSWAFSFQKTGLFRKFEIPSMGRNRRMIQQNRSGNNGGRKSCFLLSSHEVQFIQ